MGTRTLIWFWVPRLAIPTRIRSLEGPHGALHFSFVLDDGVECVPHISSIPGDNCFPLHFHQIHQHSVGQFALDDVCHDGAVGECRIVGFVQVIELGADPLDFLVELAEFRQCVLGRFQMKELCMEFFSAEVLISKLAG